MHYPLHSKEGLAARFAVPCLEFVDNWNLRLWHTTKKKAGILGFKNIFGPERANEKSNLI